MRKIYKRGFYGGKFLPFHNGHRYCIRVMAEECEEAVVIFFSEGEEEAEILENGTVLDRSYLEKEKRIAAIRAECLKYDNVRFVELSCAEMHREAIRNGTDTWDAETPYVLDAVGPFEAVYSSETGYDAYFKRAYPFAVHRLVDPPRIHVPISGTMVRNMDEKEALNWI